MTNPTSHASIYLRRNLHPPLISLALTLVLTAFVAMPAHSQTFQVLYNFSDGQTGALPNGGLAMDGAGNLYGTTELGGDPTCQCGGVFVVKHAGQGWVVKPVYNFVGHQYGDGAGPYAGVVFGPDNNLYGTTGGGGTSSCGCGTVFKLQPPPTACVAALCPWDETVLHSFVGGSDDGNFPAAPVAFDAAGNFYGTTQMGGITNYNTPCFFNDQYTCGTVFEMSPSNGGWTESLAYKFLGENDGWHPYAGVSVDASGNLYGTTYSGGTGGQGTVYELSPSGSGWTENTLYSFSMNGAAGYPGNEGIYLDASTGTVYGVTPLGGAQGSGTAFELTPSGEGWDLSVLYSFLSQGDVNGPGVLVMDSAGNLYGAAGLSPSGLIFKLTPSNGTWIYSVLHEFNGNDGYNPKGPIAIDAQGNLYGTTYSGGTHDWGTVWEIRQ